MEQTHSCTSTGTDAEVGRSQDRLPATGSHLVLPAQARPRPRAHGAPLACGSQSGWPSGCRRSWGWCCTTSCGWHGGACVAPPLAPAPATCQEGGGRCQVTLSAAWCDTPALNLPGRSELHRASEAELGEDAQGQSECVERQAHPDTERRRLLGGPRPPVGGLKSPAAATRSEGYGPGGGPPRPPPLNPNLPPRPPPFSNLKHAQGCVMSRRSRRLLPDTLHEVRVSHIRWLDSSQLCQIANLICAGAQHRHQVYLFLSTSSKFQSIECGAIG